MNQEIFDLMCDIEELQDDLDDLKIQLEWEIEHELS